MHDQTAVKTEGIADLLVQHPTVKVRVDEGYRGLATAFPEQLTAPPRKPPKDAPAAEVAAWRQARTQQSSTRICVEHAIAEHKQWRTLQRISAAGSPSARPTWRSQAWSRTGQPDADQGQPGRSGKRAPILIAHRVVTGWPPTGRSCRSWTCTARTTCATPSRPGWRTAASRPG
jgi:hypothetical protein